MRRLLYRTLFALLAASCLAEFTHPGHADGLLEAHSDCAACCCAARHLQQPETETEPAGPPPYPPAAPEVPAPQPAPADIFHPPAA